MNSHQRRVQRRRRERLHGRTRATYGRLYIGLHTGVPSAQTEVPVSRVAVTVKFPEPSLTFARLTSIDLVEVSR